MKNKIYLWLNDDELSRLKGLLEVDNHLSSFVDLSINKNNGDAYIKHHVFLALSDLSGFSLEFIKESMSLRFDLGLSIYHKRSLKSYFQRILLNLNSNKGITVKECEDLNKVLDCLNLIKSKL